MLESLFKRMIVLNRILCLFVSLYDRYYLSTYKFTLFSLQPTYMIAKHLLAWNGWRVSYFSFTTWVKLCCFVFSFHLSPWEWVDNFLLFLHTHTHTHPFSTFPFEKVNICFLPHTIILSFGMGARFVFSS